jgi:hypothetical protein
MRSLVKHSATKKVRARPRRCDGVVRQAVTSTHGFRVASISIRRVGGGKRTESRLQGRGAIARALLSLITIIAFTIAPSLARATPFDLSSRDWEGCRDFVEMATSELGQGRVVATGELDMHALHREDGVVLIHPERSIDPESLAQFMRAGGRVILLDDYGTGESLLTHFGMRRVPSPKHPAEMLRHNPALPIAEPASAHPVVADVSRVVTNHPTGIAQPDLSPVLKMRSADGPDVLLAIAGAVGQGRLLVVGDPSTVMNSMLRYPGNKSLARGIIHYAVDDDTWGKRGGTLYVLSGAFTQKGSFGSEESSEDSLKAHLKALSDAFASARREGISNASAWLLAATIGLAIVMWIGSRAGRVHKSHAPRYTREIPTLAQGGIAGHAAVLAAPGTSRVLAMLEWKSALEDELCGELKIDALPPQDVLFAELSRKRLLDAEGIRSLKELLLRLSSVETMVLSQRAPAIPSIRDREVLDVAESVKRIVAEVRAGVSRNAKAEAS